MNLFKKLITGLIIFASLGTTSLAFHDLPEYHRNHTAISYLQQEEILTGYQDGTFRPERPVTRAEFLKIILLASDIPLDETKTTPFPDVDNSAWYAPLVNKAYYQGWINGYPDGTFQPHNNINKAEAIKMVGEVQNWNIKQQFHHPYSDVSANMWFGPYIAYAKENNFLEETGELYLPAHLMTRANTSEVLYRTIAQELGLPIVPTLQDQFINIKTPWTAQAPFGEWSDIRQSEGCEEASVLMAIKWARNESLTLEEAKQIILDISQFQTNKYGTAHDTSAQDTLDWIVKDYFNYQNAELRYNVTIQEIKNELYAGNLVIAPMNGKKLPNPYFSGAGPLQHMLLIKGFDNTTQEFITNEPGTRFGENFRYSLETVHEAIYDYESGEKSYLPAEQRRNVIIIRPQ